MRFRDSQIPLADSEPRNSKAVTSARSSVADEQMRATKRAVEWCFGLNRPQTRLPEAGTAKSRLKRGNTVGRLIKRRKTGYYMGLRKSVSRMT